MWLLAIIIPGGLLVLLVVILSIPLQAVLDFDTGAQRKFRFRLRWLFGLIGKDLSGIFKAGRRYQTPDLSDILSRALNTGTAAYWKLMRDIRRRCRIKNLAVHLRFSTGDPAISGMLMGTVSAFSACLKLPPKYDIDIKPSFDPEIFFEGQAHLVVSIIPIRFVLPFFRFLSSRTGRRLIRQSISRPRKQTASLKFSREPPHKTVPTFKATDNSVE